eukprot:CCRYP_009032-RB/>CCRYP_009032-RB protein AED:0.62 eAED:0.44 QI:0/-1/0/1/-1/0/1/0/103
MPCEAARSAERRLASLLAVKWDRQYSEMVNFIRTRMSLSVVRSNTLLLRSERAHLGREGHQRTALPLPLLPHSARVAAAIDPYEITPEGANRYHLCPPDLTQS